MTSSRRTATTESHLGRAAAAVSSMIGASATRRAIAVPRTRPVTPRELVLLSDRTNGWQLLTNAIHGQRCLTMQPSPTSAANEGRQAPAGWPTALGQKGEARAILAQRLTGPLMCRPQPRPLQERTVMGIFRRAATA